jgi:hypothetical protein
MAKKKNPVYEDMEWLYQQPQFRRFMLRMFEECEVFTEGYVAGDTHATARSLGRRSKALELYGQLMHEHFEWYVVMMREARNEKEEKRLDIEQQSE